MSGGGPNPVDLSQNPPVAPENLANGENPPAETIPTPYMQVQTRIFARMQQRDALQQQAQQAQEALQTATEQLRAINGAIAELKDLAREFSAGE